MLWWKEIREQIYSWWIFEVNNDNNNDAKCLTMTDALYYCSAPILQANGLSLHKLSPYIQYVIIR